MGYSGWGELARLVQLPHDVQMRLKSSFIVETGQIDMPVAEIDRVGATKGYSGRFEVIDDFIAYLATFAANKKAAGQTFTLVECSTPTDYLNNIDHLKRNTSIDYRVELYSGAYKIHSAHNPNSPKPIVTLSNDGGGHHGLAAFFQARNNRIDDLLPGNLRVVYMNPTHCLSLCDSYHVILVPTGQFFRILVESRVNQPGHIRINCAHQQASAPWEGRTAVYLPKQDAMATTTAIALLGKGERFGILDLAADWKRILEIQCCPEFLLDKLSSHFRTCGIPPHQ